MRLIILVKLGLFIYECFRLFILVLILVFQSNEAGLLSRLIFAASSVFFPFMALFILIDINRYRAYLPLYIAGKSIVVILGTIWLILNLQGTMIAGKDNLPAQLIYNSDIFALAAVLLIYMYVRKYNMEEK